MTFGLIGYPLTHSFSRGYFTEKFAELGLDKTHRYLNFQMEDISGYLDLRPRHPDLLGINVTLPHKQAVIPYLDKLDPAAARIGAVNCIRVAADGTTTGFNTDYIAFRDDFLHHLETKEWTLNAFGLPPTEGLTETFLEESSALILGTGGASLAVREALRSLGLETTHVSRTSGDDRITYAELTPRVMEDHLIIVNTTPLGMYPKVDAAPDIPYGLLSPAHFAYDLVYNPEKTKFLQQAEAAGASIGNGMGMLERQAEAGWKIWNE